MSHAKERKERNCLNCNAVIADRYCGVCGQENLEPQETAGHLVSHFFNDITHFDGKFFSSMKYLLTKPGFLSKEYVAGRRASYLNPVRMYVFTSFIFFLIFFSFFSGSERSKPSRSNASKREAFIRDSVRKDSIISALGKNEGIDSTQLKKLSKRSDDGLNLGNIFNYEDTIGDRDKYDSLVDAGVIKDNFFIRAIKHKQYDIDEKYGSDAKRINEQVAENFTHSIPQIFFLSLPLVALSLKLFYVRRKKFYYVAHSIFTIHVFIFIYIASLAAFTLQALSQVRHFGWVGFIEGALIIAMFYYVYKAMKNFYEQRRLKTIFKFILLLFAFFIILMLAIIIMFIYSVYKL